MAVVKPARSDQSSEPSIPRKLNPCAWQAFDRIARPLAVSDAAGRLWYVNDALMALAARLGPVAPMSSSTPSLQSILGGESAAVEACRAIGDGVAHGFEIEARGQLGLRTHLRITVDPLPEGLSGSMVVGPRALVSIDDITKDVMALEQASEREAVLKIELAHRRDSVASQDVQATRLTELTDSLALAREEIQQAHAAKSELLALMSREMRAPLNGVLGMIWLLLDSRLDEQQHDHARGARESAEALLTAINDVLDYAKMEAGRLELEAIPFELSALVNGVIEKLEGKAAEKGIALRARIEPHLPRRVMGDPARLRQILLNLVSGALGSTEKGSVSLVVSMPARGETTDAVRFEVRDTGVGPAAAERERLFKDVVGPSASSFRHRDGASLGLAICHGLVSLMGGVIGVERDPGIGTTFRLELPYPPAPASTQGLIASDLSQYHVVVIAPAVDRRTRLLRLFEDEGVSVEAAVSIADGIARLREARAAQTRRLIGLFATESLSDEAARLAREIAKDADLQPASLVLLAQSGLRGDAARSKTLGYAAYLSEPVEPSLVLRCLREIGSTGGAGAEPALITVRSLREATSRSPLVLVAEAHPVNRRFVVALVERLGCQAITVADGAAAIERVRAGGIDVALIDTESLGIDGLNTARALRALDGSAGRLPIIALTAESTAADEERYRVVGIDDVVPKPIEPERLKRTLLRQVRCEPAAASTPLGGGEAGATPVLDVTVLEQLESAIGRKSLGELIKLYLGTTGERLEALERAVRSGNGHAIGQEAHDLKSTSGNLGASQLFSQARAIETAVRKQQIGETVPLAAPLREQFDAVRSAFAARYPS